MPRITVKAYQCCRCGHIWLGKPYPPAKGQLPPLRCPGCKHAGWDRPKQS